MGLAPLPYPLIIPTPPYPPSLPPFPPPHTQASEAGASGSSSPPHPQLPLRLPGMPLSLYTRSYLGLGMDAALARAAEVVHMKHHGPGLVQDPCLPTG